MPDPAQRLARALPSFTPREGFNATPIPGVHCIKISHANRPARNRWRTSLSIIAQGCKEITLGRRVYQSGAGHYVASPIDLPVVSRIGDATPEQPFLAILIELDAATLSEISAQFGPPPPAGTSPSPQRTLFTGTATGEMLETALRLTKLCGQPEDAPVLGPLAVREIVYHLLKGADGPELRHFVHSGSRLHRIYECIHGLRSGLSEDIDVLELAQAAHMSRSAFFQQFKDVTGLSPIQYQKRLRLLEARRLMIDEDETAESSAFRVGYRSPSQFNREYARMFGAPPARDAQQIRRAPLAHDRGE